MCVFVHPNQNECYEKHKEVPSIITTSNYYSISIHRSSLFLLTAVNLDVPPLLIIEAQHNIFQMFVYYFKDKITETLLRENFSLVYQLLDEIIIGGFPHTTELNQLSDMILPPTMVSKVTGAFSVKDTLPSAFHNTKTQWRKSDCKYVTNEIKIDIIEAIDCILQASSAFKAKAIVSFINGQLPLDITPNIKLNKSHSTVKIEINKSMNVDKTIDKILLEIPFPAETLSFTLSASHGKVSQDEITKIVRWHIGKFPKSKTITLDGTVAMPSDWESNASPNIRVGFEIKGLSLSNLRVDSLAVHNVKYKPFKGVRHITKAGTYLIRCT
eukprot:510700_1